MHISPNIPRQSTPEVPGNQADCQLLKEDKWLMNTEVRYILQERKSQWHLTMIYIAIENAMKFICRKIDIYTSKTKAETYAKILQRGIRKDARGTQKTTNDAFDICTN